MRNTVTIQIHTGGFDSTPASLDIPAIKKKLSGFYNKTHVECVMIGWNPKAEIGELVDYLRQQGTGVYLWLPVFSGLDGFSPLIGTNRTPVVHSYKAEKGERFDFGCPADHNNIRHIKQYFEANFSDDYYDGIFLDKIRFPSFISGKDPVLTCFCPFCQPLHNLSEIREPLNTENPLDLVAYTGLRYEISNENLAELFAYKARTVTDSVTALATYFRGKGYKIGLDLFAPYLSFFVGQDYNGLAKCADFIKPMFYRETYAPAGLPFELNMYAAAFGGDPHMIESRKQHLLRVANTSEVNVDFINREIIGIREVIGDTKLYAGIEINYNERIAPITAPYIRENISQLKNADGFALSWDLCSTPDDNISAALEAL